MPAQVITVCYFLSVLCVLTCVDADSYTSTTYSVDNVFYPGSNMKVLSTYTIYLPLQDAYETILGMHLPEWEYTVLSRQDWKLTELC